MMGRVTVQQTAIDEVRSLLAIIKDPDSAAAALDGIVEAQTQLQELAVQLDERQTALNAREADIQTGEERLRVNEQRLDDRERTDLEREKKLDADGGKLLETRTAHLATARENRAALTAERQIHESEVAKLAVVRTNLAAREKQIEEKERLILERERALFEAEDAMRLRQQRFEAAIAGWGAPMRQPA